MDSPVVFPYKQPQMRKIFQAMKTYGLIVAAFMFMQAGSMKLFAFPAGMPPDGGTATFMLLGDTCTRHCRFCNIAPGRPLSPDPQEPFHVAEAAARLGLRHVVITSVARDDLPDGGAAQFAQTIRAVRSRLPHTTIEVLVPDFGGSVPALEVVAAARPDVFNHNIETVPRLYPTARAGSRYRRSLDHLRNARSFGIPMTTKSGLMLGLGENQEEVVGVLSDLREAGVDIVTLGQYLQPTSRGPLDGDVKKLADRITKGKSTNLLKAKAIYDWTVENMYRDPDTKGCGQGDVCELLRKPGGKCTDISSVFIALCRASGVPAREIFSIRLGKKPQEDITTYQHCWAEFFVPGYGWVTADPADVRKAMLTENLKPGDAKTAEYRAYFWGGIDPYRVKLSMGRDLVLNPPNAYPADRARRLAANLSKLAETQGEDFSRFPGVAARTRCHGEIVKQIAEVKPQVTEEEGGHDTGGCADGEETLSSPGTAAIP